MTKAVFLDLGNVIVGLDYETGYRATAKYTKFDMAEIPTRIRAAGLLEPFETGRMSNEEFQRRFCAALEMDGMPFQEFRDLWSGIFPAETLVSEKLIAGLGARNRLFLLSNTNDIHFQWIHERYPHLKHFHDYVLSYRVGALKPSAAIYEAAIQLAGCEPSECFFADDIAENVEAARRSGIDAVLFTGEKNLKLELAKRNIAW
jgi:putative hydrolase of the HAD superfamily